MAAVVAWRDDTEESSGQLKITGATLTESQTPAIDRATETSETHTCSPSDHLIVTAQEAATSLSCPVVTAKPSLSLNLTPAAESQAGEAIQTSHPADEHGQMKGISTPKRSGVSQSDEDSTKDGRTVTKTVIPEDFEPPKEHVEVPVKTRNQSGTKTGHSGSIRRLSVNKMQKLTAAPESIPIAPLSQRQQVSGNKLPLSARPSMTEQSNWISPFPDTGQIFAMQSDGTNSRVLDFDRSTATSRPLPKPLTSRRRSSPSCPALPISSARRSSTQPTPRPPLLDLDRSKFAPASTASQPIQPPLPKNDTDEARPPSPIPPSIPLPPMAVHTVLQLELAGQRPSPLYIHHSFANDIPYESSAIKFERLKSFLMLPGFLERTMNFGALACLDAWLWTFTILPMRFFIAIGVLVRWWGYLLANEIRWVIDYVWHGLGRMWRRGRRGRTSSRGRSCSASDQLRSPSRVRPTTHGSLATMNGRSGGGEASAVSKDQQQRHPIRRFGYPRHSNTTLTVLGYKTPQVMSGGHGRHLRTKSMPSDLTSFHKADMLQGLVIIFSSMALMHLDASRVYHFIRAQSQIKLYVIFNLLEVGDKLLAALGQDIFECLFSSETLSRTSSGRSKVMLPFGMFLLALVYNVSHAAVLFYQVITLNVAVNSYSNALLSLLMSNQFIEVKGSVFKRFEKENSFQLTCADIVERFQLWVMLLIVGMRNVVEVGGLSVPGAGSSERGDGGHGGNTGFKAPLHPASVLPASFTILPSWLWSGEVLSPFLIVIGSEMVVDWIKHAYINKFNSIKPTFYSRILDILCKDYYTNAFVTPSLTRRLGLPLLPLSCLFIRASIQTYHMFLATHVPTPLPPSRQTSLTVESATASPSPAIAAALDRLDNVIRNALGRVVYGYPCTKDTPMPNITSQPDFFAPQRWLSWTSDDLIAALTMAIVFLLAFLVLLIIKLLLGMLLLRWSRDRYASMKLAEHAVARGQAERESFDAKGRRVGGYGAVEVGEDRRRWIYADDVEGLKRMREKEKKCAHDKGEKDYGYVKRYEMIGKRIW